ncbi:MAG: ATP-binding cassette domain-containing protein [Acidobacteria bacterium]|nr:ATP-binding cassette domain-containing protein [Acidobacteriota bacterium]
MIEVDSLLKTFGETLAVDRVSFAAQPGEILGVLGPNGAGKTTTLRILCGYLAPTAGTARVQGLDVVERSLDVRRRIGYLPENFPLYPEMKVGEYLRFRAALKGIPRRRRAAEVARVLGLCGLEAVSHRTIGTLSKGYRQRVALADALAGEPPVLVLDEPTTGLDPNQAYDIRQLIRSFRGGHTILLSSHILSEVEQICDRVVIFRRGKVIAEDTPAALSGRVRAGETVSVEFAAGEREALLARLPAGVTVAAVEDLGDGWCRASLEAPADPRAAIFRAAADAGLTLRELSRRTLSLEEIFHELTTQAESPAAGPSDGEPPAAEGAEA